jgi:two-component system cell cycle sensor histidine kinase/response regulator CckA
MSLEFDQISSQIPIILWTTDREMNFTAVAGGGVAALNAARNSDRPATSLYELFQTTDPKFAPMEFHRRALDGESVSYEYEFAGRFYDTHLEPLRTNGAITGVIGVATDITDQKRASKYRETQFLTTKILAESDTLHEAIVRFLEAICRGVDWDFGRMWHKTDESGRLELGAQWQSPNFETKRPIATAAKCAGQPCIACTVAESGQAAWVTDITDPVAVGPEIINAGLQSCFAFPIQHGHEIAGVMEFFSCSTRFPDFEMLKAMTDIGSQIGLFIDRKKAEQALVESEAKFRAVADTASSAIYIQIGDHLVYANQASERITAYSLQELLGMSVWDLVHPDDVEWLKRRMSKALLDHPLPQRHEFRLVTRTGEICWIEFNGAIVQFGGDSAVVATVFDITERKRAAELQSALYRIATLASSATDLKQFYKSIHDIVAELMTAKNFYIAVLSEDGERIEVPYFVDEEDPEPPPEEAWHGGLTEYVLRSGKPLLADPQKFDELVKAGEVLLRGAPSLDWLGVPLNSGETTFGVLVVQSYSEKSRFGKKEEDILNFVSQQVASTIRQRRGQEALQRSEERYRSQVESAVYGLYRSSVEGKFLDVNPSLVQMLGYDSPEELYAMHMARDLYVNPNERQKYIEEFSKAKRIEGIETRWRRKDGKLITVRLSGRAGLKYPGEPESFEMICEDITERRMLEEQLLHSQKMEAVGRLAGGVAHDFNNLLTVIKGYSELMLNELSEKDPMRGEVEEVRRAAERAASLTRQLLAFSRRQVLEPKVLDLNSIITNMEKLLLRLLGEDVELQVSLSPSLGMVKADPGQLEQVIMNLAVNARDAMPRGGKLTLETHNHAIDETAAREHAVVHAGQYAMMAVSDTGMGMDPETASHIFEPFFTTKETGKGTGLGLSTVYGIVKQSGGYIWVYSEPGRGTSFKIYLPIVKGGAADESGGRPTLTASYRGTETILLVEDEDGVRALIREVLQRHGYRVIDTRNGTEATDACERHEGEVHMLLTDVVLAQATGTELARQLIPMRPKMKVLFISGYTEEAIIHQGVLEKGTAFLQKPFTPNVLARKVREVLDGKIGD